MYNTTQEYCCLSAQKLKRRIWDYVWAIVCAKARVVSVSKQSTDAEALILNGTMFAYLHMNLKYCLATYRIRYIVGHCCVVQRIRTKKRSVHVQ